MPDSACQCHPGKPTSSRNIRTLIASNGWSNAPGGHDS
jgi:hypothetical protein